MIHKYTIQIATNAYGHFFVEVTNLNTKEMTFVPASPNHVIELVPNDVDFNNSFFRVFSRAFAYKPIVFRRTDLISPSFSTDSDVVKFLAEAFWGKPCC